MARNLTPLQIFFRKTLSSCIPIAKYRRQLRKKWLRKEENISHETTISSPISSLYSLQTESYFSWMEKYDSLGKKDIYQMSARLNSWSYLPVISILLPVYNTDITLLTEAVSSVKAQIYPHWELCISDDNSPNQEVRTLIEKLANEDKRIKYIFRAENGHISENTNSALELATGEFIALMDHDDTLAPHALWHIVHTLQSQPDADILYSDEDKIDSEGRRSEPCFKQDWNEELMLHWNYVSHLGVYRTSLARKAGGFRKGFEGSQDHDFTLRCALLTSKEHIVHIPWILYHWRNFAGSGSVSDSLMQKCEEARYAAVRHYLSERNRNATVKKGIAGFSQITYALPASPPLVSCIILWHGPDTEDVMNLVEGLLNHTTYDNIEIVLVCPVENKNQPEDILNKLKQSGNIRIMVYEGPPGKAPMYNWASQKARGQVLAFIDNRISIKGDVPNWLSDMLSYVLQSHIGSAGACLLNPDDSIQHAGLIVKSNSETASIFESLPYSFPIPFFLHRLSRFSSAVSSHCLLMRKDKWHEVHGMNETLGSDTEIDLDLCKKLSKKGWENVYVASAVLYRKNASCLKIAGTCNKIKADKLPVNHDPYYSPHLSLFPPALQIVPKNEPIRTRLPFRNN